jgi:hypothetical protein
MFVCLSVGKMPEYHITLKLEFTLNITQAQLSKSVGEEHVRMKQCFNIMFQKHNLEAGIRHEEIKQLPLK